MEEFHRIPIILVDENIYENEIDFILNGKIKEKHNKQIISNSSDNISQGLSHIQIIRDMKKRGIEEFYNQSYKSALYWFSKALDALNIDNITKNITNNIDGNNNIFLKMSLYSNIIACNLELENYEIVINDCRYLLNILSNIIDNDNILILINKTKYRLSLSLWKLEQNKNINIIDKNKIEEAFQLIKGVYNYFTQTLKVNPSTEVDKLYSTLLSYITLNYKQILSLENIEKESKDIKQDCIDEIKILKNDIRNSHIIKYIDTFNNGKIIVPTIFLNKIELRSIIDFLKIWNYIENNIEYLDYFILYIINLDILLRLFKRSQIDVKIMDKILNRIFCFLDIINICIKSDNLYPENIYELIINHLLGILKGLIFSMDAELVIYMVPCYGIYKILDCILIRNLNINTSIKELLGLIKEKNIEI
ncbi:uncharacterized protein CMU_031080 [Cryptosporidium muris RN66]|uniref:Uncharacterized protein n=1 Tax=Cryptosporidium muris (strain RN66) TaxID=441375 RepID=B6AIC6_CRYMR|nr:uncharacterized protein CMU_031080 [Cryptosporidium muris RN66]EEA07967.1 hypothetical protein, conserved [Cryptosporidium muris RN66]|eukprot:XP_002142316.1 hypothetical protein [Cryptosporidium muris RN66]